LDPVPTLKFYHFPEVVNGLWSPVTPLCVYTDG